MSRTLSLIVCIALGAGYLIVGLWPFELQVKNNLGWQPGEDGTYFGWLSNVYTDGQIHLGRNAYPSAQVPEVSIELYLQSEHKNTGDIGTILSFYEDQLPPNLVIAQWRSELLLRTPVQTASGRRAHHEISVSADLRENARRFIVVTSGAEGTSFYVDGMLAKSYPRHTLRQDTLRGRLIVGDAPEGSSHWAGKLIGLAIFSRSLGAPEVARHYRLWARKRLEKFPAEPGLAALYDFGERAGRTIPDKSSGGNPLLTPEYYRTFRKTVLIPPWRDPHPYFSDIGDVGINVLGFVPFGFFYFLYRSLTRPGRRFRNFVLTALVSGIISVAIELIQVFMPIRSSSLTDLLCNIGGGLAGALLALMARSFFRPRIPRRDWSY
ncbi:MAG: VanZ family protein [Acidobacteria bacterium]|nr:VanZ family protein [Acidobacteriota bacterium]